MSNLTGFCDDPFLVSYGLWEDFFGTTFAINFYDFDFASMTHHLEQI